jgi:hypothetical protein
MGLSERQMKAVHWVKGRGSISLSEFANLVVSVSNKTLQHDLKQMAAGIPPEKVAEKVKDVLDQESFHDQPWMSFVIHNFLLTIVARNFSAHTIRQHEDLLRPYYPHVIAALFQTLVFVWMYAKKEGIVAQ